MEELGSGRVSAGWNVLRGQVTDTVYLGTHTQTLLRLPGDHIATFVSQNCGPGGALTPTSTVELALDPAAATILAG